MSRLFYTPKLVRVNSAGVPYVSARANFFLTGSTTKTDTYTDSDLATASANPVIADSTTGQFAPIYLDPTITYRCVLTDSASAILDDVDPIAVPYRAGDIDIVDSGGLFDATNVEDALRDIGGNYTKTTRSETITADWNFIAPGTLTMTDQQIIRPELKDLAVTHTTPAATATVTCDMSLGNSFAFTLTANVTVTLSNPSPTGNFCQTTIRITQDGSSTYTVTWPASVKWTAAPTMSPGNNAVDVFTLFTTDAGVTWYGSYAQAFA